MTGATAVAQPIRDNERADVLDALRGFALLGILISHIPDFSGLSFMTPAQAIALDNFGLNAPLGMLQDVLIRGKFYSLFSLLFGIGFIVQLESAARREADFARHFARRLTVLLVIGLIHAGLWYGDILKDYAAIGFVLIPLGRAKAKTIAWAAASVFALRLIWPGIMSWLLPFVWSAHARPDGGFAAIAGAFGGNNLSSLFFANLELVQLKALQTIYEGRALSILSMFLLGAWVGKLGLYRVGPGTRKQLSRAFWICAPVGIIGNAVLAPLHAATPDFPPNSAWVLENTLYAVAIPAMAVAYASGFAWLWASGWRFVLQWLAPAGRMALTTYISQTLIGIALFYGVGFGLHGQIGLLQGTILAFAIFAAQCAIARFWLRRFHFGPIEWIWRRLTYGAPITFVRTARPIE